jgi:hypothetical protein
MPEAAPLRDDESATAERAERPRFMPSPVALNWLITLGFVSLLYAMYVRYLVIEQSSVGLACDAGLRSLACFSHKIVSPLFDHQVFGWTALGAAMLALVRPSVPLFAIGLAASAVGIVLYNAALCGVAAALLILCFARPAGEPE